MKNKMVFIISFIGALSGIAAAILSGITEPTLPPAFNPAASPYPSAIYAEGIVESAQTSGENINIYPEVAGTVKEILVSEGQQVKAGQPLLRIDDSIQRATAEQQGSSAEAAAALLRELKAQPRKENLDVADAQVVAAEATLKTAQDTLQKEQAAYEIDPRSVSKDALDSALNAAAVAKANLIVAKKQDDLTKAGAWIYDIQNQERQQHALAKAYAASSALLAKYTLRAPRDGVVLAINTIVGNYVSPQGSYDAYTQGADPVISLGEFAVLSSRSLLRRRDSGPTVAPGLQNESANVHSWVGCQDSVGIRPGAAVCFSENRAFGSTPGARGCPRPSRDFQDREARECESLSR